VTLTSTPPSIGSTARPPEDKGIHRTVEKRRNSAHSEHRRFTDGAFVFGSGRKQIDLGSSTRYGERGSRGDADVRSGM
jgi:hypothetical protein